MVATATATTAATAAPDPPRVRKYTTANLTAGPLNRRKVFATGQVAALCGCASRTVAKWFDSGRLKGYRIPGSNDRRIPRECLIRFLRENGMPLGPLADGVPVLLVAVPAADAERVKVACGDGFTWASAAGGFAAGVAALDSPPAAVVIDLALGRSEASVIAGHLRALPGTAGAVLVALAGEDGADGAGLLAAGFDAVIQRPFHPAAVAERLLPLAG